MIMRLFPEKSQWTELQRPYLNFFQNYVRKREEKAQAKHSSPSIRPFLNGDLYGIFFALTTKKPGFDISLAYKYRLAPVLFQRPSGAFAHLCTYTFRKIETLALRYILMWTE